MLWVQDSRPWSQFSPRIGQFLLPFLSHHWERIQMFHLTDRLESDIRKQFWMALFQRSAPNLERFHFNLYIPTAKSCFFPSPLFNNEFPRLKSFSVYRCARRSVLIDRFAISIHMPKSWLHQIRILIMKDESTVVQIAGVLQSIPLLEELEIDNFYTSKQLPEDGSLPKVLLPNLRKLCLLKWRFPLAISLLSLIVPSEGCSLLLPSSIMNHDPLYPLPDDWAVQAYLTIKKYAESYFKYHRTTMISLSYNRSLLALQDLCISQDGPKFDVFMTSTDKSDYSLIGALLTSCHSGSIRESHLFTSRMVKTPVWHSFLPFPSVTMLTANIDTLVIHQNHWDQRHSLLFPQLQTLKIEHTLDNPELVQDELQTIYLFFKLYVDEGVQITTLDICKMKVTPDIKEPIDLRELEELNGLVVKWVDNSSREAKEYTYTCGTGRPSELVFPLEELPVPRFIKTRRPIHRRDVRVDHQSGWSAQLDDWEVLPTGLRYRFQQFKQCCYLPTKLGNAYSTCRLLAESVTNTSFLSAIKLRLTRRLFAKPFSLRSATSKCQFLRFGGCPLFLPCRLSFSILILSGHTRTLPTITYRNFAKMLFREFQMQPYGSGDADVLTHILSSRGLYAIVGYSSVQWPASSHAPWRTAYAGQHLSYLLPPMTVGVLDKLPQELRDACFDTLCDFLPEADRQQALRTCLLVCREWNHQARSHLFSTICIENRDCLKSSARSLSTVARLRDVLNDGHVSGPFPRLCSYIKSFQVKIVMAQPLWTQVDEDLSDVMKMLAHSKSGLSELDVEVNGREWQQLSEGFRESLHALCHSEHLRTLKIGGITRMPSSFFYGISLDDLWIDFRESPTVEDTILSPPDPKGSPLLVMDFSSHTAFYPYDWDQVKDPRNLVGIKRIATSFYLADLEVVFELLSLASRTLESLQIVRLGFTRKYFIRLYVLYT